MWWFSRQSTVVSKSTTGLPASRMIRCPTWPFAQLNVWVRMTRGPSISVVIRVGMSVRGVRFVYFWPMSQASNGH